MSVACYPVKCLRILCSRTVDFQSVFFTCILVGREPCVWLPVPSDKDRHILDYKKLETVFQAEKTDLVEEVGQFMLGFR